jgi:hypothetical protein
MVLYENITITRDLWLFRYEYPRRASLWSLSGKIKEACMLNLFSHLPTFPLW